VAHRVQNQIQSAGTGDVHNPHMPLPRLYLTDLGVQQWSGTDSSPLSVQRWLSADYL